MRILILMSSILLSGCFYLVPDGKGGVAERMPHHQTRQHFYADAQQRLQQCEIAIEEQTKAGLRQRFPSVYYRTEMLLVRAERLYTAGLEHKASESLHQAELLLRYMAAHPGNENRGLAGLCGDMTDQSAMPTDLNTLDSDKLIDAYRPNNSGIKTIIPTQPGHGKALEGVCI